MLNIPIANILMVSNYALERSLDPLKDVLIFAALNQMLRTANDSLEDLFLKETGKLVLSKALVSFVKPSAVLHRGGWDPFTCPWCGLQHVLLPACACLVFAGVWGMACSSVTLATLFSPNLNCRKKSQSVDSLFETLPLLTVLLCSFDSIS